MVMMMTVRVAVPVAGVSGLRFQRRWRVRMFIAMPVIVAMSVAVGSMIMVVMMIMVRMIDVGMAGHQRPLKIGADANNCATFRLAGNQFFAMRRDFFQGYGVRRDQRRQTGRFPVRR